MLQPQNPMDGVRWELPNGIRMEMNRAEVKKILGDKLKSERGQYYYNSDKARVEIDFSQHVTEGEKDEAYKVFGIYIRQGTSAATQPAPSPYQPNIPQATKSCTDEVAKWWQEVRAAALQVFNVYHNHQTDLSTAREKYVGLLREGQAKGYKAPVEDTTRPINLYFGTSSGYPKKALEKRISGKIQLRIESLADGTVGNVIITKGLGFDMDFETAKSVRDSLYLPTIKDGVFIKSWASASVEYN